MLNTSNITFRWLTFLFTIQCDFCVKQQPSNGLFSRTTWVSRYQKGKTNLDFTGARDSEWQWHQLAHMQVCTSLQTDNHANTPPLTHPWLLREVFDKLVSYCPFGVLMLLMMLVDVEIWSICAKGFLVLWFLKHCGCLILRALSAQPLRKSVPFTPKDFFLEWVEENRRLTPVLMENGHLNGGR